MKKRNIPAIIILVATIAFILAPIVALAGDAVMDRAAVTISTTAGTATWTQNVETANIELRRVSVTAGLVAGDTVTVTRVTGNTKAETNVIAWLVLSGGNGASNLVHAAGGVPVYMKRNDKLTFASGNTTGSTAYVEYLIQSR